MFVHGVALALLQSEIVSSLRVCTTVHARYILYGESNGRKKKAVMKIPIIEKWVVRSRYDHSKSTEIYFAFGHKK